MRKAGKILALTLSAAALAVSAAFTGCDFAGNNSTDDEPYYNTATVYAQAQQLGYNGTLEEFIELISGKDGETGERGDDGVSVKSGRIDEDGHLILTLTDDSEIDCGAVKDTHTHTFSEWILIKENNCTTAGLEIRTCECGYTESKITPVTDHIHLSWATTDTTHTLYCTDCQTVIKSGEHNFVDGECECGMPEHIVTTIPVEYTNISQKFEFTKNPSLGELWALHTGIDFDAPIGTDVVAAMKGTVESININTETNLGNSITLLHWNGVRSVYLYVDVIEGLAVGDEVKCGQLIATVAEAAGIEYTQDPHLHFEITVNGINVDPEDYLVLVNK